MKPQNILIVGGGGREHALAWKISKSPRLGKLFMAPGNPGTAAIATNIDVAPTDKEGLVAFAKANDIGLTVVGPDDILALGLVDAFRTAGLRIFGPTQAAARIESSKAFSKQLMTDNGIPTAKFATFTEILVAKGHVREQTFPLVIKASGLALGKGVYIVQDIAEADAALDEIMSEKIFGDAGSSVVIEDFLTGQEVSVHAFSDGHSSKLFPPAQDHKTIFDHDQGPNTGGMGAFAPVKWVTSELMDKVKATVVDPALAGLAAANSPFTGLLYPGLMVNGDDVKVLEYNSRFGDPETQVFMRLLESDLMDLLDACVDWRLADQPVAWSDQTAVAVALASPGYPASSTKGLEITGVAEASALPDVEVFQAGTKLDGDKLVTNGGRVLYVSATGTDLADARNKAYAAVAKIHFEGMQYRTDIGDKSLS
jgi:phosphoribosylamine--glycine ligase